MVDLGDPAIATSHLRPRFVQRVCAPTEIELLEAAPDPMTFLWSLFAAKEAAYKAVCKLGPPPILAHRRFVAAGDLRSVEHEGRVLLLRVQVDPRFVHAVATTSGEDVLARVEELPGGTTPGTAVRLLLARSAGELLGASPDDLEIVRPPQAGRWDRLGPPVLLRRGQPAGLDVSLSHDGRFVACAAVTSG